MRDADNQKARPKRRERGGGKGTEARDGNRALAGLSILIAEYAAGGDAAVARGQTLE